VAAKTMLFAIFINVFFHTTTANPRQAVFKIKAPS